LTASRLASSPIRVGLVFGRRLRSSNAAAGQSCSARRRRWWKVSAGKAVLGAERRHAPTRRVVRPLRDRRPDAGVNRFIALLLIHPPNRTRELPGLNTPEPSEISHTDLSGKSCKITRIFPMDCAQIRG
jgi:hypothetical protein